MSPPYPPPPDTRIHEAARAFGSVAPLYEQGRPEYPGEAIGFLVAGLGLSQGNRVLDLAAGTGKFTRALRPFGFQLTAVEPTGTMRAELERCVPGVTVLDGTAESIPLPDRSLDAVTVAQAFHWFEPDPALAEIARVLRAGGGLAVVFNRRDERVPWVADLSRIVHAHRPIGVRSIQDGAWREAIGRHPSYEPGKEAAFEFVHHTDPEGVVARVLSVSYIAGAPGEVREQVARDVRTLLLDHPATAGRAGVELPYRTQVYLARTRGG
jgi:SAM-dependent methyltransferase